MKNRKKNRLKEYNYSLPSWYYVTICTKNKYPYFGKIVADEMRLSAIGLIAKQRWELIPDFFVCAEIDEFIIMPDHIHGIVAINDGDDGGTGKFTPPFYGAGPAPCDRDSIDDSRRLELLPNIIGQYKASITRLVRGANPDTAFAWQKSYHDHVVRSDGDLARIREYIQNNPLQWSLDKHTEWLKSLTQSPIR